MITATIDGTYDYGACGTVPLIRVPMRKPDFRNNGYGVFSGLPRVNVPDLRDVLSNRDGIIPQGHVMIVFECGGRFGSYASAMDTSDNYDFC